MVIGIEGLVGAGKTSICRELLNIIPNAVLLHGGNLYRAIVYALLQEEKNILKLNKDDIVVVVGGSPATAHTNFIKIERI